MENVKEIGIISLNCQLYKN